MPALTARKANRKTETALTREIMVALNRLPGVRVFRNNTGALPDRTGRIVYYGLGTGSPDLVGWKVMSLAKAVGGVAVWYDQAVFLGIEVKVPGKMKAHPEILENQDTWRDMIQNAGGLYFRVTSVGDAIAALVDH